MADGHTGAFVYIRFLLYLSIPLYVLALIFLVPTLHLLITSHELMKRNTNKLEPPTLAKFSLRLSWCKARMSL